MTRWLWALGYGTASLVLVLADHRWWGALVVSGAVAHLWVDRGARLRPTSATLDHVIPHSQGGSDDPSNLLTCCWRENRAKGNRTPEQWAAGVVVDTTARERAFIPPDVRAAVYARDNWKCQYCGVEVS